MYDIKFILEAFIIACTAVVYSCVLTEPGEIFNSWYKLLHEFFKTDERESQGLPPHPFFKVLVHCEKCVSGQLALWIFMIEHFSAYRLGLWTIIVQHILFVGFTIFCALVAKWIYKRLEI